MNKVIATGVSKEPGEFTFIIHYKGDAPTIDEAFEIIRKNYEPKKDE